MSKKIYIVVGPTASGKTRFAIDLAHKIDAEILSCDSTAIYRSFDIGTAKPTVAERTEIPHHFVDHCDWSESFDAGKYACQARAKIEEVLGRGKEVIVAGGTGLYLRALMGFKFHNLPSDPDVRSELENLSNAELYNKLRAMDQKRSREIHLNDRYRLLRAVEIVLLTGKKIQDLSLETNDNLSFYLIYLDPFLDDVKKCILERIKEMLHIGFIDEVENLRKLGCPVNHKVMQSVGYREVNLFLDEKIPLSLLPLQIVQATNQYARRQRTWFSSLKVDLHLVGTVASFLKNCPHI